MRIPESVLIILSFGAIYFIWGSTYLLNYFAIQDIPPFLMAGTRFFVAGCLLYGLALSSGKAQRISLKQLGNVAMMGILFLSIGTGGTVWAEQYVDTGMAALITTFQPLLTTLLMWLILSNKPNWKAILGVFLGMVGMSLLIGQPRLVSDDAVLFGIGIIGVSVVSWSFASVVITRLDLPVYRAQGTALQMVLGGLVLILSSLISGESAGFATTDVGMKAGLSWIYLVIFGSMVTFSAFNYLLQKVSPDIVATSTYVNPVVAMLLGWAFNNEVITSQSTLAAIIMLTGVFFIHSGRLANRKPLKSM
ncbi:MAG TPA: EamA family transporter [Saprospiraceae bacterium]|nr:EamA family transporter [Saprospiraceae bacterium]HMQ83180.1 EamA family transporter [Saprospiraceae bacterium]